MYGVEDAATIAAVRAYVKLLRASRAVVARTLPRLAEAGLTHTQLGVLEAVLHLGPLTQRDLTRKLLTSPGNLTDVIDKLARRGLVERVACKEDRRSVRVVLTDSGRAFIEGLFPGHAEDIAAAMAGVTGVELAELDRLLRRLGKGAAGD
ncbi:MarR family transcriptional regulator [Acidiphilium sp. AL]|uniref:MarR family transcriptional regulator n=1 Tax=Acidiphilium iwatense TaxID=768198 RepID=A0ABS9E2G9_9PROT|nr:MULTISPECIES: MarR family transcriptional regulator [Acidiphilium]MCF3947847.1 MarR family transcriptional regulator [Acidiphilium iwatense]MCU4160058.1 MarR family transcriptional regulator [Acidiphilium sp. AL]